MNLNTNYLLSTLLLIIPFFIHAQLEHADLGIAFTHAKENKTWNSDYIILNDSLCFKQHSYYDPIFIEIIVYEPRVNNQGSLLNMN